MAGKVYRANMTFAVGGEVWREGTLRVIPSEHLPAWEPFITDRTIQAVKDGGNVPAVESTDAPSTTVLPRTLDASDDEAAADAFANDVALVLDALTQFGPVEGSTLHVNPLIAAGNADVATLLAERPDYMAEWFDDSLGQPLYYRSLADTAASTVTLDDGGAE